MNHLPRRRAFGLLAASLLLAACGGLPRDPGPPPLPPSAREALAPTGTLRVAVYPGSPTSLVREAPPAEMRGLSVDLGRELGGRLGVPVAFVVLTRVAEVVEAVKSGRADFAITNATPARAQDVDFSAPVISLELGYLSLPGSPVQSLADVDQPGVRVGVSQGSTSQGVLGRELKHARVVPVPSLQAAREMLARRELEAFATNKAILHELADQLPTARVLDGRWGLEHLAMAIPKGRQAAMPALQQFAEQVQGAGLVARAAERAGLRGTAPPAR